MENILRFAKALRSAKGFVKIIFDVESCFDVATPSPDGNGILFSQLREPQPENLRVLAQKDIVDSRFPAPKNSSKKRIMKSLRFVI